MTNEQNQTDWTLARIVLLRALWTTGLSTSEIGKRLQITKNAVIGKVHRLKLPARPSPIRSRQARETATTPAPARAPKPRPPATERIVIVSPPKPVVLALLPMTPPQPSPFPPAEPEQAPTEAVVGEIRQVSMLRPRPQRSCAWPLGHPGTTGFRYCGEDTVPTKPYCQQHCCQAYVRVTRQDAATA